MDEESDKKRQRRSKEGSSQPWVEKYRPSTLDELVAHKDIISIIKRLISEDKLPHMLLYGPPGTGKTSTITAAAKDMYGKSYGAMTLELNASDDRGIDVVRNQIKEFAGTRRLWSKGGVKLVILDEADFMTSDAQFALRRVIEKYTSNTRFCLVCNYANKIIPALQSRCTKFRFAPLDSDQIRGRLQHIFENEQLKVDQKATRALLELGGGDMRRVLNILQATSVAYPDKITYESLFLVTGNPLPADIDSLFDALLNQPFHVARDALVTMCKTKGYALQDVLHNIVDNKVLKTHFPPTVKALLLDKLSDLEYRASFATTDQLQLSSLVAAFAAARSLPSKVSPHEHRG